MTISEFVQSPLGIILLGALGTLAAELVLMSVRGGLRRLPSLRKRLFSWLLERAFRWFQRVTILSVVVVADERPFGAGIFFAYHLAKLQVFSVVSGLAGLVLYSEFRFQGGVLAWWGLIVVGVIFVFSGWHALTALGRIVTAYVGYWFERTVKYRERSDEGIDLFEMLTKAKHFKAVDLNDGHSSKEGATSSTDPGKT